jgi:hypothetical protein
MWPCRGVCTPAVVSPIRSRSATRAPRRRLRHHFAPASLVLSKQKNLVPLPLPALMSSCALATAPHLPNRTNRSALNPSTPSSSPRSEPSHGMVTFSLHCHGDLTEIPLQEPLTMVSPLRCISSSLVSHRCSSRVGVGVAVVTGSRHGRGWPTRHAQHRRTRHCGQRPLHCSIGVCFLARSTRLVETSTPVPSVSLESPPAVSSHRRSSSPALAP